VAEMAGHEQHVEVEGVRARARQRLAPVLRAQAHAALVLVPAFVVDMRDLAREPRGVGRIAPGFGV